MTLPTSVLGLSDIQNEFGGSNPIGLSEYYGVNANVASSGLIRMAEFLGISADKINTSGTSGTNGPYVGFLYGITGSIGTISCSDGAQIITLADDSGTDGILQVGNLTSDPGIGGWATTLTVDGIPRSLAGASAYSYDSGLDLSTWTFGGSIFGFVDTVGFTLLIV